MIGVIQRPRLYFIDGLRGIAALIVAVGHLIGMVGPDHPVVPIWNANLEMLIIWPWTFGGPAVWLFILLSGFALFWAEESRRLAGRGNTGLAAYIKRRFWRILPTYYMSLFLGLIVVVVMAPILIPPSPSLQTYSPTSWMGFIAHVFLFQNLDLGWRFQFVPPLWSISVEMQLYIILPLIFSCSVE